MTASTRPPTPEGRRRPPPRPPATPESSEPDAPRPGRHPFRTVLLAGAVLVVGVIAVAAATGTVDDLPWGAIIGVVVVMAFAYIAGRRRRIPHDDETSSRGGPGRGP